MKRHRILLAVLSALALTMTACSASGPGEDSPIASLAGGLVDDTPTDGETVDPDEAFLKFAECMRDHDVPMEDPGAGGAFIEHTQEEGTHRPVPEGGDEQITVNGVEVDPEVFEAAQQACEPLLEEAIGGHQIDPAEVAEMQDQMHEFGECMRDRGIDWQDPIITGDGGQITARSEAPGGGPDGGPGGNEGLMEDPETEAALEECREIVGDVMGPGLGERAGPGTDVGGTGGGADVERRSQEGGNDD